MMVQPRSAWALVTRAEQAPETIERWGEHSTWCVVGEGPLGPFDLESATPFEAEPALFAAPLVQRRDGSWALIGFRNLEPQGIHEFEILDPIPVELRGDRLVATAAPDPVR